MRGCEGLPWDGMEGSDGCGPGGSAQRAERVRCVIGLPGFLQMTITSRGFLLKGGPAWCCDAGGKGWLKTADCLVLRFDGKRSGWVG
jgi:hypothetical protein